MANKAPLITPDKKFTAPNKGIPVRNLVPHSDGEADSGDTTAHQELFAQRLVQNRRDKRRQEHWARLETPLDTRRVTQEAAHGTPFRAKKTSFEEEVEQTALALKTGRVSYDQFRLAHQTDEARLMGWEQNLPQEGTHGALRLQQLQRRVALRAAVLDREEFAALIPPVAGTAFTAPVRESWTDVARTASLLVRRARAKVRGALATRTKSSHDLWRGPKGSPFRTFDDQGRMIRLRGAPVKFGVS